MNMSFNIESDLAVLNQNKKKRMIFALMIEYGPIVRIMVSKTKTKADKPDLTVFGSDSSLGIKANVSQVYVQNYDCSKVVKVTCS